MVGLLAAPENRRMSPIERRRPGIRSRDRPVARGSNRGRGRVAAAVGVLALSGVTAPVAGAATPPSANPAASTALPTSPARIEAAIAQLDSLAPELLRRSGVPGAAIAVVHDDRLVYAKGFGVRDVRTGTAVDADTVFQLASVSKSIGATVVARAVSQGKVAWDDPVQKLLPGFRLSDPAIGRQVTVADLYSHRSGLPGQAGDLHESLGFDRDEILERLRYAPLAPFRTVHQYANFGLTAGAEAVARHLGVDWATLSQRLLYGPLGMTSTSSRYRDFRARGNRAALHTRTASGWRVTQHRRPDAQWPAGGVSSSVRDLAQWMRLQLADGSFGGRRLIGHDALAAMRTPHSVTGAPGVLDARPSAYGLGIGISVDATGRVRYAHSGAFSQGAGTRFVLLPAEKLGIVVLTNGQPIGVAEAISDSFLDLATRGELERDWLATYGAMMAGMLDNTSVLAGKARPTRPRAARPRSAYVGTYDNPYYGTLTVRASGGRLTMRLGPKRQPFALRHWSGDRWSFRTDPDFGGDLTEARFSRFRDGRAGAIRVEHLDADGMGTFRRR